MSPMAVVTTMGLHRLQVVQAPYPPTGRDDARRFLAEPPSTCAFPFDADRAADPCRGSILTHPNNGRDMSLHDLGVDEEHPG